MAMGIVSDSDLQSELESLNRKPVIHKEMPAKGRGHNTEVPEALRKIIGEESINGTPAKIIEAAFGISPSSISAYKHDATSTASYNQPNQGLKKANNRVREVLVSKARKRLVNALNEITPEKVGKASLKELTQLSVGMANVIDKVEQKDDAKVNIAQMMIYAPRVRDEQSYDVIEVRE